METVISTMSSIMLRSDTSVRTIQHGVVAIVVKQVTSASSVQKRGNSTIVSSVGNRVIPHHNALRKSNALSVSSSDTRPTSAQLQSRSLAIAVGFVNLKVTITADV